jgi:hypothetical protein
MACNDGPDASNDLPIKARCPRTCTVVVEALQVWLVNRHTELRVVWNDSKRQKASPSPDSVELEYRD